MTLFTKAGLILRIKNTVRNIHSSKRKYSANKKSCQKCCRVIFGILRSGEIYLEAFIFQQKQKLVLQFFGFSTFITLEGNAVSLEVFLSFPPGHLVFQAVDFLIHDTTPVKSKLGIQKEHKARVMEYHIILLAAPKWPLSKLNPSLYIFHIIFEIGQTYFYRYIEFKNVRNLRF